MHTDWDKAVDVGLIKCLLRGLVWCLGRTAAARAPRLPTQTPARRAYLPSSPVPVPRAFSAAYPGAQPGGRCKRARNEWEQAEASEICPWFGFASRWRTLPVDMTQWRHITKHTVRPARPRCAGVCAVAVRVTQRPKALVLFVYLLVGWMNGWVTGDMLYYC